MSGTGSGICCISSATFANGSVVELNRARVKGQHDRCAVGRNDPEVLAIRRITGQRNHPGAPGDQPGVSEIPIDRLAQLCVRGG